MFRWVCGAEMDSGVCQTTLTARHLHDPRLRWIPLYQQKYHVAPGGPDRKDSGNLGENPSRRGPNLRTTGRQIHDARRTGTCSKVADQLNTRSVTATPTAHAGSTAVDLLSVSLA
jgi:hypothetical protein